MNSDVDRLMLELGLVPNEPFIFGNDWPLQSITQTEDQQNPVLFPETPSLLEFMRNEVLLDGSSITTASSSDDDALHVKEEVISPRPLHRTVSLKMKNHVCQECGYACNRSYDLKVHRRTHTKERPYLCRSPECGKSFSRSSGVREHERKVHGLQTDTWRRRMSLS
eukprot:TRINITY_DN21803_c0_g1_i1.p1 TRINITY_DN21803_c0_g1~~TRINITY_DN21803_c0_g1_i1.p1  ORF type:complete len:166 (+),score=14.85 TRINITY_DN21803_c0_g1_i1:184-681(+)